MPLLEMQMVLKLQDTLDCRERKSEVLWKLTLLEFLQTHDDRCSRLLGRFRDIHSAAAAVTTSNW